MSSDSSLSSFDLTSQTDFENRCVDRFESSVNSSYTEDLLSSRANKPVRITSHTKFFIFISIIFCIFFFIVGIGIGTGVILYLSNDEMSTETEPHLNTFGYLINSTGEFGYFETTNNINYYANYQAEYSMEVFPFGDDETIEGSEYNCELIEDWEVRLMELQYDENSEYEEDFAIRRNGAVVRLSPKVVQALISVLMTIGTLTIYGDSMDDVFRKAAEIVFDKLPEFIKNFEVFDWIRTEVAPYLVATTIFVCWWKDDLWKKRRIEATASCVYCEDAFDKIVCGNAKNPKKYNGWKRVDYERCDIPWETKNVNKGHRLVQKTGNKLGTIDSRGVHNDVLRKLDFQCYRGRRRYTTKADRYTVTVSLVRGQVRYDHCEFQQWELEKYACLGDRY